MEGSLPNGPGTLYVNDSFIASQPDEFYSPASNPHGIIVAGTARQQGFRGAIVGSHHNTSGSGFRAQARDKSSENLKTPSRTRKQTISDLRSCGVNNAASLLDDQTRYLERLTRSGASNSVANLSLGASKASTVNYLYNEIRPALVSDRPIDKSIKERADVMLQNVAEAGGLSVDKLRSDDAKVANAERGRLTQFLIDQVSKGMDSDQGLSASRRRYDKAVRNFEAGKNSVVVSAGNHGDILPVLREQNGNYPLKVPADFSRNVLENREVTSVGSTEYHPRRLGQERRAAYTSHSAGIDVYANGGTGLFREGREVTGTSFAAPRVAATMAELHERYPHLSSSQIESLMQQQMTHTATEGGETMNVLDNYNALHFLSGQTF